MYQQTLYQNQYHLRDTQERKQQKAHGSSAVAADQPAAPAAPPICFCCLATKDLRALAKPYLYQGKNEIYSNMLATCFTSELSAEEGQICADCVRRLRAALSFRKCVESARAYLATKQHNVQSDNQIVEQLNTVSVNPIATEIFKEKLKDNVNIKTADDSESYSINNDDHFADYAEDPLPVALKAEAVALGEAASDSDTSDDDDDDIDDFFNCPKETPHHVFSRTEFDVGEQRTLPYVLDNTDRTCEICHKEFSFFGELLKHMPEHYPNHICDICGKICATRKSLVFHAKTHTDVRLACQLCDKSFKNKSNLNAHVKVQHRGEKIYFKCSLCGDMLNTYNSRIKHMAEKHGREDKAYKCLQCPCRYRLGSHLRAHVRRVHLQEKNHRCGACGISFFTRKCLENHALKHSGERGFVCGVCHKTYGRKESLRQHLKTHEAAPPGDEEPKQYQLQSELEPKLYAPPPHDPSAYAPMRTFMRIQ